MIEALTQLAQLGAGQASPAAVPLPAAAGDAEQFRALMNAPAEGQSPAKAALTASELGQPLAVASGQAGASIGQNILDTMQQLSSDTRARFAKAEEVLSKPEVSMSDLLGLQFTLLQTSVQFEIASKGISKLTQNVESVLKTQ